MSEREVPIVAQGVWDEIGPWFGDFADNYDLAPIIAEFADAVEAYVQSATSEDVTLVWTGFHSPVCWAPLEVSSESVAQSFSEALGAVDLESIASKHER